MVTNKTDANSAPPPAWPPLLPGEVPRWEGRPAPRCYVFRLWRQSLLGVFLTVFCTVWTWLAVVQADKQELPWLAWVPLPFLAFALWLAVGQLLAARWEWRRVAYAITDRRVIVRGGLFRAQQLQLDLGQVTWFRLEFHAEELGSLRILGAAGDPVLQMHGIEYPRRPAELLEAAIKAKEQG